MTIPTKPKKITIRQIEAELKRRVSASPDPAAQKRKEQWFKRHVIIDMPKAKDITS